MNPDTDEPLMVAVVSGKGGVGKTMLSVAIANELARGRRTLLVDLDFFNRGLTGLFASLVARSPQQVLSPPAGLVRTMDRSEWVAARISDNLFVLAYGDVDRLSSTELEEMDSAAVAERLRDYLRYVCHTTQCEIAVLDCHGGPDNTSFAACMIARYSILVSEPDKITLYGTLNFLRTLESTVPDRKPDVRLVFNKIIPAFSSRFLYRFYRQFLAAEFAPHDLLAIYPMEPHLTKAFEKTPFLTTVFPTSQLAEKTRLLLYELFGTADHALLPVAIQYQPRPVRWFHRYYMGRWPKLLDLDFIIRLTAVVAIVLVGIPALTGMLNDRAPSPLLARVAALREAKVLEGNDLATALVGVCFVWLIIAAALKWARDLDVVLTYAFRSRAPARAVAGSVAVGVLCLVWGAMIGSMAAKLDLRGSALDLWAGVPFVALALLPLLRYGLRGIGDIWHDRRLVEGSYRLVAGVLLPGFGILAAVFSAPGATN